MFLVELAVEGGISHRIVVKHLVYRNGRYFLSGIDNWATVLTQPAEHFKFPPGLEQERKIRYWCVQDKDIDNFWHYSEGTLLEQLKWFAGQTLLQWRAR